MARGLALFGLFLWSRLDLPRGTFWRPWGTASLKKYSRVAPRRTQKLPRRTTSHDFFHHGGLFIFARILAMNRPAPKALENFF